MSTTTLADVAAEARVHAATVSRALTRPELVHPDTLARVNAAVARLGYVPNRAARQLARGRTSTLAVLVPDVANPFFAGIVQAAQRRAAAADLLVVLADTTQDAGVEVDVLTSLAAGVDGAVVCSPVAPTSRLERAARGRPLVFVNRRARSIPSVAVDQRLVVDLAVEHLRSCGHERIAVARGPAGYWSSTERERHARRHADVELLPAVDPTFAGGRALLSHVRAAGATGVAAFNDVMALGLQSAAIADGLRVPGDLAVVGSDGIPFASMTTPSLTTVAAPLDQLAHAAVELLLAVLDGGGVQHRVVEPHLVRGGSS